MIPSDPALGEEPAADERDEAAMFEELPDAAAPTEATILERLAEVDDRLAIGGRAYLRADLYVPEVAGLGAEDVALGTPALLELYSDVRPNDHLRAYARGRVTHDFSVQEGDTDLLGAELAPTSVVLDQLWISGDLSRRVYLTLGRQRIKWGAGRFWNPTDFLNQQVLDPLAAYDERTGIALVKAHVPWEGAGLNLTVLANLEGAGALDEVGGAARLEWLVGNTEVSVALGVRKDDPVRLGADLSTAIAFFDLRLEGSLQRGLDGAYYEGELDFETLTLPTEVDWSGEWIPRLVAGVEVPIGYGDEDVLTVGIEGFRNGAGYADSGLYAWLLATGAFQPFYLGEWYAGAYVYLPAPGAWNDQSFTLSALANLSDRSGIARLDWRATVLTRLSLNAYVAGHGGEPGGEFRFALDIPPVPTEGLEEGLVVPPPLFDAGVGLQLVF